MNTYLFNCLDLSCNFHFNNIYILYVFLFFTVKPTLSTMEYNHDSLVDSNYTFSIRISNNPFPPITTDGIRWLLNGMEFSIKDNTHYELVLSNSTIELNIKAVVVADGGIYTLIVGNTAGNTYLSLALTVHGKQWKMNACMLFVLGICNML